MRSKEALISGTVPPSAAAFFTALLIAMYSVAVGTTLAPTMASSASTMPRISRPKNEMPRCEDRCAVFILSLHLQSRLFS